MDKEFYDRLIKPYGNKSGRSGVKAYGVMGDGDTAVFLVIFQDDSAYAYAPQFAGQYAIDTMRGLAVMGEGLATYIARERPLGMKIELIYTATLKKPDRSA
jgi:hypothetical protein